MHHRWRPPLLQQNRAIETFLQAINAHDRQALQSALTDDFVFEEVAGAGEPSTNALWEELQLVFSAFPDITFRPVRETHEGGRTYVEFRAMGTHTGAFLNVPATGTVAIVSGVFNLETRGERVNHLRLTVDFGGLRRQLLLAARRGS